MPEVVVIDEIGNQDESMAARTISQRGVQMVATAHGHKLENLLKNPALVELLGGIEMWVMLYSLLEKIFCIRSTPSWPFN